MTSASLADIDFHDAVLESVSFDWPTASCTAHFRLAGPPLTKLLTVSWHGVAELHVPHAAPWGASASVLELRRPSAGVDELVMQSGDVIRVRAAGRRLERGAPVSQRYADLAADALADAELLAREQVAAAAAAIAHEISVRRSISDL